VERKTNENITEKSRINGEINEGIQKYKKKARKRRRERKELHMYVWLP
jgi:hypothetical protein